MATVISVNRGHVVDADWAGRLGRTAIDKQPVAGPVTLRTRGFEGDERADKENHDGLDHAVYCYAREDLDWWASQLGRELRDGVFGENLTLSGVDVNRALIGERWRVGGTLLEVTGPRVPCGVFRNWMGERGWVRRFTAAERIGAYLRVLAEGPIAAGDPVAIEYRPDVRVTVVESFHAYHGDQDLMERLLTIPAIGADWHRIGGLVLCDGARPRQAL
jgi:MOSC domain-containing protein YiiM